MTLTQAIQTSLMRRRPSGHYTVEDVSDALIEIALGERVWNGETQAFERTKPNLVAIKLLLEYAGGNEETLGSAANAGNNKLQKSIRDHLNRLTIAEKA